MGMLQKAVIGSLIVGAGALALAQNKKTVIKIRKNVDKAVKKVMHNGGGKSPRSIASKLSTKVSH